jgi:hypothetical protein
MPGVDAGLGLAAPKEGLNPNELSMAVQKGSSKDLEGQVGQVGQ